MFGWPPLVWGMIAAAVGADLIYVVYAAGRQRRERREEEMRQRREFDRRHGVGKGRG